MNFDVKFRVKTEKKYNEKIKIVNSFQNSKWKSKHATELNNRFEMLENIEDEDNVDNYINEKWENIKTIIKETKQRLIERDESIETLKNRWYDGECKTAIEEMKKTREKQLIKARRENEEQEYHHKRKAHKIIKNKKSYTLKMKQNQQKKIKSIITQGKCINNKAI